MATIDNLQLSIEATDRASSKIESLAHALSSLKNNIPKTSSLNSVAKGVKAIADSANEIDGRTMSSVASKVSKLASALNTFRSVPNGTNLKNVGEGIKSVTTALNSIDGRSATSIQNKLTKLGTGLSSFPRSIASLKNLATGIIDVTTAIDTLSDDSIARVERLGNALKNFQGLNVRGITRIANRNVGTLQPQEPTSSMQEVTDSSTRRMSFNLDNVRSKLASVAGTAISVGLAIGKAFATTAIKGFRFALEGLKRVLNTLTAPLRNIIRSLGRIAFYRVIRSLIKEIGQGLKEGIQNLARFSKLMNELDTHSANRVMSLYASNLLYFKNAVATAVIPILKSLEPIFDAVINKAVALVNVMAQLFSYLSGSDTYTRAKYYYIDYAESLDKASGSAGKLNKQLAQFDELNNLTTSSGSGSGNELDYLKMFEDPIPIEDWVKNIGKQDWSGFGKRIADKITETLQNINWTDIKEKAGNFGRGLAGFLNGFLDEEMFASLGSTLAQGLNTAVNFAFGFGEEFDGSKFGKGVANGINAFFRDFDFNKLGLTLRTWATKLGDTIKSAVENVDWEQVYKSIGDFLEGLGVRRYVTFYRIPDEIENLKKEWQNALDAWGATDGADLLLKIGEKGRKNIEEKVDAFIKEFVRIFKGAWQQYPFASELDNLMLNNPLITTFVHTIKTSFSNIKNDVTNAVMSSFPSLQEIVQRITKIGNTAVGTHTKGGEIVDAFGNELVMQEIINVGKDIGKGILVGLKVGVTSYVQNTAKSVYTIIKGAIKEVFGISSPAKNMYDVGENIVLGIIEGFSLVNIGGKLTQWFNEKVKPVFSEREWRDSGNNAKKGLSSVFSYSNFYSIGDTIGKALYTSFNTQLNNLYDAFKSIKAQIEGNPITQTVTTNVTTVINSVADVAGSALDAVKQYNRENLSNIPNTTPTNTSGNNYTKTPVVNPIPEKLKLPEAPSAPSYIQDYGAREQWRKNWLENWKKQNPAKTYYANGGFPTMGSMFVAGERGAELVGNINGRTGVANTLQIEDAMYQAVYDATSRALSENDMSVTIEGDMDKVFRVMQNKSQNFFTRTGRPAF